MKNERNEKTMKKQWKKMKVNGRNWQKKRAFTECFFIPYGIRKAARAAPLFPYARSKLFQNVHFSNETRGVAQGTPARGLRGTWIWRREISVYLDWGASAVSSRALIWRFWYEGRTWPTRRPPFTTLNLIITRMCTIPHGKVTTSQYKANKASSECALFSEGILECRHRFCAPEKKRETKWKRKKHIEKKKGKQKENKGIKNENMKNKGKMKNIKWNWKRKRKRQWKNRQEKKREGPMG